MRTFLKFLQKKLPTWQLALLILTNAVSVSLTQACTKHDGDILTYYASTHNFKSDHRVRTIKHVDKILGHIKLTDDNDLPISVGLFVDNQKSPIIIEIQDGISVQNIYVYKS